MIRLPIETTPAARRRRATVGMPGATVALILVLGGCSSVAGVAGSAALTVALEQAASEYTGGRCDFSKMLTAGRLCEPPPDPPPPQRPVYCYRTLGAIDCYPDTDPYRRNHESYHWRDVPLADPVPAPARATAPDRVTADPSESPRTVPDASTAHRAWPGDGLI